LKVTIIGSGYVGLVTGACLAEKVNNVYFIDLDPKKIEILNSGVVPI
jgi:UDPglucose 6-dehydrogenase